MRYLSHSLAAPLPSLMAQTTSDWPRRQSPAAKTPLREVVYFSCSALMLDQPSPRLWLTGPAKRVGLDVEVLELWKWVGLSKLRGDFRAVSRRSVVSAPETGLAGPGRAGSVSA